MAIQFEPFECMMTHSTCYTNTTTQKVLGVLWHSTGANNDMIKRYVQPYKGDKDYDKKIAKLGLNKNQNDWNHIYKRAGLNCWIGKDASGKVCTVQTMPWNYRPWGCGCREYWNEKKKKYEYGPSCNDGWIQFEICEEYLVETYPGSKVWVHKKGTPGDAEYAKLVWDEAVRFTAWICVMYNLDPMGTVKKRDYYGNWKDVPVILDHRKSWELGFGSGHGDVEHWFKVILGKTMEDARKEVKALIDASTTTGWVKKDGKWYYYDENGKLVKSEWIKYKGKWYYVGADGAMLTGWQTIEGKTYYLYPGNDGHMAKHEWIDGLWLDNDGAQTYPYKGEWKSNSKGKWWEDTNGYYPKGKTERIDKVDYVFDEKGYLVGTEQDN